MDSEDKKKATKIRSQMWLENSLKKLYKKFLSTLEVIQNTNKVKHSQQWQSKLQELSEVHTSFPSLGQKKPKSKSNQNYPLFKAQFAQINNCKTIRTKQHKPQKRVTDSEKEAEKFWRYVDELYENSFEMFNPEEAAQTQGCERNLKRIPVVKKSFKSAKKSENSSASSCNLSLFTKELLSTIAKEDEKFVTLLPNPSRRSSAKSKKHFIARRRPGFFNSVEIPPKFIRSFISKSFQSNDISNGGSSHSTDESLFNEYKEARIREVDETIEREVMEDRKLRKKIMR